MSIQIQNLTFFNTNCEQDMSFLHAKCSLIMLIIDPSCNILYKIPSTEKQVI